MDRNILIIMKEWRDLWLSSTTWEITEEEHSDHIFDLQSSNKNR